MCILDLSKNLMFDFHYNYIKKKYGQDARGIFKNVNYMINEDYKNALFVKENEHDIKRIFSKSHHLGTLKVKKFLCHVLVVNVINLMMKVKL